MGHGNGQYNKGDLNLFRSSFQSLFSAVQSTRKKKKKKQQQQQKHKAAAASQSRRNCEALLIAQVHQSGKKQLEDHQKFFGVLLSTKSQQVKFSKESKVNPCSSIRP
jgi:hypothetical protein